MCSSKRPIEMLDFLFERDDCKAAEDSLRSTLFSNAPTLQHNSFKQELMTEDDVNDTWKGENEFDVDEILGSYFAENDNVSSGPTHGSKGGCYKEEDFESLKDFVSLPFESVIDSFDDQPGYELNESASESGFSSDHVTDIMLSPSSGAMSPDPRGDISIDTMDAASDVSSTSDLGSMGSAGSSPVGANGQVAPLCLDLTRPSPFENMEVDLKDFPVPISSINDKVTSFFTTTSVNGNTNNNPRTIFTQSTPRIKIELANPTKILPRQTHPIISTATTNTTRTPILTKVRLDTSTSTPSIITTSTKTTSPQTIVVTQAGRGAPLLRNGALLKAASGRSILLPVNVSDLNQVRTIKIISAGSANVSNRAGGVRTLVSTVRPVTTSNSTTTRTTFFTTSKGSDGRSLLKVTPTALVSPTTCNDAGRTTVTPSFTIKDEPLLSDDETPLPNQELVLTDEERRLMRKEGLILPARYPLTKQEERDLKRIRRKIRNKISAQDSRKRKKEYVDGLEDRVKNCSEENQQLQKRIKNLEKQNETLVAQLKKFQSVIGGSLHSRSHNHTSTALMMLILSAALFIVPSLRPQEGKGENDLSSSSKMPAPGHSRSLLEAGKPSIVINGNVEMFENGEEDDIEGLTFTHALSDHDYSPVAKKPRLQSMNNPFFSSPNIDKAFSTDIGDPPDGRGGLNGVAAMIGAMLDRLGSNWTDPGGSIAMSSSLNKTPRGALDGMGSSVVVSLTNGQRLRDDIELE